MTPTYQREPDLTAEEFIGVLVRSTLAERRPVYEPERVRWMLAHADLVLTARVDGLLVGVSRALTDFAFCTYLSDLAVDERYQRQGIGRELIRRTHEAAGLDTTLILLAAFVIQTFACDSGVYAQFPGRVKCSFLPGSQSCPTVCNAPDGYK